MNTNMTGFRWFSKIFAPLCLDKSSLSIGRIKSLIHSVIQFWAIQGVQFQYKMAESFGA